LRVYSLGIRLYVGFALHLSIDPENGYKLPIFGLQTGFIGGREAQGKREYSQSEEETDRQLKQDESATSRPRRKIQYPAV